MKTRSFAKNSQGLHISVLRQRYPSIYQTEQPWVIQRRIKLSALFGNSLRPLSLPPPTRSKTNQLFLLFQHGGLRVLLPFLWADSGGVRKSPAVTLWVGWSQGDTLASLWGTLLPLSSELWM